MSRLSKISAPKSLPATIVMWTAIKFNWRNEQKFQVFKKSQCNSARVFCAAKNVDVCYSRTKFALKSNLFWLFQNSCELRFRRSKNSKSAQERLWCHASESKSASYYTHGIFQPARLQVSFDHFHKFVWVDVLITCNCILASIVSRAWQDYPMIYNYKSSRGPYLIKCVPRAAKACFQT